MPGAVCLVDGFSGASAARSSTERWSTATPERRDRRRLGGRQGHPGSLHAPVHAAYPDCGFAEQRRLLDARAPRGDHAARHRPPFTAARSHRSPTASSRSAEDPAQKAARMCSQPVRLHPGRSRPRRRRSESSASARSASRLAQPGAREAPELAPACGADRERGRARGPATARAPRALTSTKTSVAPVAARRCRAPPRADGPRVPGDDPPARLRPASRPPSPRRGGPAVGVRSSWPER